MAPALRLAAVLIPLAAAWAAGPALTIYNQNFAVVRDSVPLDLKAGANRVSYTDATAYVEPESVMLRDASGKYALRILEQSYRSDPISMEALLAQYVGKTIEFQIRTADKTEIVQGKIIRAGAVPYGTYIANRPMPAGPVQTIIEVAGKLRFDLPGTPLFPALSGDAVLKPTLDWVIHAPAAAKLDAELAYVTAGMNWEAQYNIIQTSGGRIELIGWVTMENRTGRAFENARVKLMAGDVNKIVRPELLLRAAGAVGGIMGGMPGGMPPQVTEKAFDDYHLYTLPLPITLRDRELKQVEFVRAANVNAGIVYVYDGAKYDLNRLRQMPAEALRMDASLGAQSSTKVWIMREFANSKANQLGIPLPKGKTRFYRRDTDAQMEFTGEDTVGHTPEDETVRVFTGAAFDIVGERRRTTHRIDHQRSTIEEAFEIKVRNRKKEAAEVRVVEHMYRWSGWDIPVSSVPFTKKDADTVEFKLPLQPGEEKTVTYMVRYTW